MTNKYRIAVVQSRSYSRTWAKIFSADPFDESTPPETQHLDDARDAVAEAAGNGAKYVAFPELYPGPMGNEDPLDLEAVTEHMTSLSKEYDLWILWGGSEEVAEGNFATYNVAGPDGDNQRYRKLMPACDEPWTPANEPYVVQAGDLKLGLGICWEAWFPEISRTLALMGADVIFFPTGGLVYELKERWKTVLAARAAENVVYTAACVNILAEEEGMAVINSPEHLVAESGRAEIIYGDVDLERLKYLRETNEKLMVPKRYHSIPGLLKQLRPEILEMPAKAFNASKK